MNPVYKLYLRIKRRDYCFKHDHPRTRVLCGEGSRVSWWDYWNCVDCEEERKARTRQCKEREIQRYYE